MDPGLPIHVTVLGEIDGHHNIFKTKLHWFFAAVAVELISIALVAPT